MRVYTFKAEPELMEKVASYASRRNMTVSEVVRRAIKCYLDRHREIRTKRLRIYAG